MQYILFIHNNASTSAGTDEWNSFFEMVRASGMFSGGSEIDNQLMLGTRQVPPITDSIGGVMRFETTDKKALLRLLENHPVLRHGGTLELCEMPRR